MIPCATFACQQHPAEKTVEGIHATDTAENFRLKQN